MKSKRFRDRRYDLSIIKKVDSRWNADQVARVFVLIVLGTTLGLTHDLWRPVWFFAAYLAMYAVHAVTVAKMPRRVGPGGFAVVATTNALIQLAMIGSALYLWNQPDFEIKCLGLFMLAGKMVNSMSERSEDRLLVVSDVLAMTLAVSAFYFSFSDGIHLGSEKVALGIGFALVLLYFLNGVMSVRGARQRLRRAQAKVIESQKMDAIGRLTGAVAHDFNNLLTAILGNLELAREVARPEEQAALFQNAHASAQRAARLTAQLLAYARRAPLDPQELDLAVFLASSRSLLQGLLEGGATLKIGEISGAVRVRVDPALLETALVNLVLNARDAMTDAGQVTLSLTEIRASDLRGLDLEPGSYVALQVSDMGCGIPKRLRRRVLEPFFSTKGVGKGSGLGLSVAKGFAEQSGGALWLQSAEGRGTQVTMLFPQVAQAASSR